MSAAGEFSAEAHGTWSMPDQEQPEGPPKEPEDKEPEEEPQAEDQPGA